MDDVDQDGPTCRTPPGWWGPSVLRPDKVGTHVEEGKGLSEPWFDVQDTPSETFVPVLPLTTEEPDETVTSDTWYPFAVTGETYGRWKGKGHTTTTGSRQGKCFYKFFLIDSFSFSFRTVVSKPQSSGFKSIVATMDDRYTRLERTLSQRDNILPLLTSGVESPNTLISLCSFGTFHGSCYESYSIRELQ